jgi:single-stranded DNA-binding protein
METKIEKKYPVETISGYLGGNPKEKVTKENDILITFSVANHIDNETVEWINIRMSPQKNEVIEHAMTKGDFVELRGYFIELENKVGIQKEFIASEIMNHKIKTERKFKDEPQEIVIGNLGQTPEIKKITAKDEKMYTVAVFSIADHSDISTTNWTSCQVWDENIGKNNVEKLGKGDFVELKGFRGREYQTKSGEKRRDLMVGEIKILKKNSVN